MMRDGFFSFGSDRASGVKTKDRPGHQVGHRFRERFGSRPRGLAHPGFNPIHRGRSRPGWQNRLLRADSFLMRGKSWKRTTIRPEFFLH
jgi:hypothetical protein